MFKWIEKGLFVQTKEGGRKLGPLVYLLGALLVIIPSILLFKSDGSPIMKKAQREEAPAPFQKPETELTSAQNMPNTMVQDMEREIQIAREQGSGLRVQELEERKKQIEEEYKKKAEGTRNSSARINFTERVQDFMQPPKEEPKKLPPPAPEAKKQGYMTFAERMATEGKAQNARGGGGKQNNAIVFEQGEKTPPSSLTKPGDIIDPNKTAKQTPTTPPNLLPLGTFLPVVLEQDIISTDLQSHVWATLATDVTFRRQLQIPLGLVRLRGRTATEPTQNLLDIVFDVMVFSDGTELPIQGFAYSAFDIRYPDRYRVRGVPGKLITPPMYTTIMSLLLTAGLGASDAYIQNYLNQNTTTDSTFTTVPQIDPITGQTTTVLQQSQGQPVNNQIGATIGLGALQSGAEELVEKLKEDLDKYRPYVKLEKGTPLFVQLDATVDVGTRQINGFAIKAEEERQKRDKGDSSARSGEPDTFPAGDARYRYDGRASTPSVINPLTGTPTQNQGASPVTTQMLSDSQKAAYEASQTPEAKQIQAQQQQEALNNVTNLIQQIQQSRATPATP